MYDKLNQEGLPGPHQYVLRSSVTEGPLLNVRPLRRRILHVDNEKGIIQLSAAVSMLGILSVTRLMTAGTNRPHKHT